MRTKSLPSSSMFIPVTKVKESKLVHGIWKIEKDELGYETRSFVHDDLSSELLQHLPDDTEEERSRPGYGVIPGAPVAKRVAAAEGHLDD